jgi:hypothetical protein
MQRKKSILPRQRYLLSLNKSIILYMVHGPRTIHFPRHGNCILSDTHNLNHYVLVLSFLGMCSALCYKYVLASVNNSYAQSHNYFQLLNKRKGQLWSPSCATVVTFTLLLLNQNSTHELFYTYKHLLLA